MVMFKRVIIDILPNNRLYVINKVLINKDKIVKLVLEIDCIKSVAEHYMMQGISESTLLNTDAINDYCIYKAESCTKEVARALYEINIDDDPDAVDFPLHDAIAQLEIQHRMDVSGKQGIELVSYRIVGRYTENINKRVLPYSIEDQMNFVDLLICRNYEDKRGEISKKLKANLIKTEDLHNELFKNKLRLTSGSSESRDIIELNMWGGDLPLCWVKKRLDDGFNKFYGKFTKKELIPELVGFDTALNHMKTGKRVYRSNWNGKNMYLFIEKKSNSTITDNEGNSYKLKDQINIKLHNGEVCAWVASQSDLLENDWIIKG